MYHNFVRTDVDSWTLSISILTHCFCLPRILFTYLIVFFMGFICFLTLIGHNKGEPIAPWRYKIVSKGIGLTCFLTAFTYGIVSVRRKETDQCYKKYLGPDSKPSTCKAGIYVSNHMSCADILAALWTMNPKPAFVAKEAVRNLAGFGYLADALQCVFVDRGDS